MPEGGSDTWVLLGLDLNVIGRPSNLGGIDMLAELVSACERRHSLIVLGERDNKTKEKCKPDCPGGLRDNGVATSVRSGRCEDKDDKKE